MARIMISLHGDERDALLILAQRERRDPREQAALCIRHELERRGLLKALAELSEPESVTQVECGAATTRC